MTPASGSDSAGAPGRGTGPHGWRYVAYIIVGPYGPEGDATAEKPEGAAGWMWIVITAVVGIAGLVGWALLDQQPSGCPRLQSGAQFAGTARRFAAYAGQCDLSGATPYFVLAATWLSTCAVAFAFGVALFRCWPKWPSWTSIACKPLAIGLPVVTVGCGFVATALTGLAVATADGAPLTSPLLLALIPTFAWPRLVAGVFLVVIGVVVLLLRLQTAHWNRKAKRAELRVCQEPRKDTTDESPIEVDQEPAGLGIACSGGGIRSGIVTLGALSVLERTGTDGNRLGDPEPDLSRSVLGHTRFISSVSGGGYIAGAWFAATGAPNWYAPTGKPPAVIRVEPDVDAPDGYRPLGDPPGDNDSSRAFYDDDNRTGHTLFRHVEAREQYLRTGRGGLLGGGLLTVLSLLVNLAVVLTVVVLIAWPIGRVARSWYIFGGIDRATATVAASDKPLYGDEATCTSAADSPPLGTLTRTRCFADDEGRQHNPTWAHLLPLIVFGGLAVAVTLISCLYGHTRRRRRIRLAAAGLAAIAVMSGLVVIVGPWLLDVVYPQLKTLPKAWAFVTGASFAGIALVVYRQTVAIVKPRLVKLSGYLVAVFAGLAGIYVAGNAATAEGPFGFDYHPVGDWLGHHASRWGSYGSVLVYAVAALLTCAVLSLFDPRWWSLHAIYRARLRNAFATRPFDTEATSRTVVRALEDGVGENLGPRLDPYGSNTSGYRERDLFEYASDDPPLPEPSPPQGPRHLICTTAARRPRSGTGIRGESVVFSPDDVRLYSTDEQGVVTTYLAPTRTYMATLPNRMRAESMIDAISGAAVAPSMGRMHQGSVGTTLALANVRLGVWMPNPRWFDPNKPTPSRPFHYPRAGLAYLFKELTGLWSTEDRRLYLTDGGHWDNLGLVELIRRRCRTIICIDASGDRPGSFASLRNAAALAKIQCKAEIRDLPDVVPEGGPVAQQTCWKLTVSYPNTQGGGSSEGTIIYLLAGLRPDSPAHLLAFAAEDDVFPNYSTANQLLSQRRFRHLFAVGRDLVENALGHTKESDQAKTLRGEVARAIAGPETVVAEQPMAQAAVDPRIDSTITVRRISFRIRQRRDG